MDVAREVGCWWLVWGPLVMVALHNLIIQCSVSTPIGFHLPGRVVAGGPCFYVLLKLPIVSAQNLQMQAEHGSGPPS